MGVGENQDPQVPCVYVEELEDVLCKVHVIAREDLHEAQMRQKRTYYLRIQHHTTCDVGDFGYMIDSSTKIGQSKKATEAMDCPICCDREIVVWPLSQQE